MAAEYGYLDVVEGFLDPKNNHNVDVNTKDAAGNTALGTAALGRRLPVVARLLQEADIDVIVAMEHKVTILHVAAGIGSVEMLDLVLKTYPNLINAKTTEGKTALDAAVWNNHGYAIIRLLQEADIDINEVDLSIKDKNGNNLVHLAAQGGVVGVLETLKKSAPNFNALLSEKNNDAKTPLDVAKDNDHQVFADALQGLIDANLVAKDPNVLDERIIKDLEESSFSKERIEYWLAKGLNINARDDKEFNWTLLMHVIADKNEAARTDHKDVVKYLLQQKDIDLSAKGYVNLIQWAVGRGDSVAVGLILETHPEIDLDTYKDSNNLVHLAAQGGFVDVLAELKGHIANYHLTEKNKYGKTPVEVAQENGHQPFVDALQKLIDNME